MGIRRLTDEELDAINRAKDEAKAKLSEMRATLRKNRRSLSSRERGNLGNQIAALAAPKGKPVICVLDDGEIYLDYEFLTRFTKTLDKQRFWYQMKLQGTPGINRCLIIQYGNPHSDTRGDLELFELSPRHRDLLHGLPRVELQAL